jgi:hypothetical protein
MGFMIMSVMIVLLSGEAKVADSIPTTISSKIFSLPGVDTLREHHLKYILHC